MAYAALVSLERTTDEILNHNQYPFPFPVKKEIGSIYDNTIFLQAFLEDFPEKANGLEGRITDVANEAEDIIEYFMPEKMRSHSGLIKPAVWRSRTKFRLQLKEIADEIVSITAEAMDIKNSFVIKDVEVSDFSADSSSSRLAPTGKDAMIGFEEDLMAMKARLCGEPSKLQVLPIVGMGGIGKTTLARNVYDDQLIIDHFQIRAWVTVSQDYNAQEILWRILVSMKEFNTERSGLSNEESVYKTLKSRRYLIVLDDMWSTKAWDDVRNTFPDDDNGSRIMLTTRLSNVAAYPNSSIPLYEMRSMDAHESWNLLRQKVFKQEYCPPELENIGKKISRNCKGLPMAIVVIAGLLSTGRMTRASWEEIAKSVSSAVATNDAQFEKILTLSYTHLPHHLRPCFLYLGCFPEDYTIHVSKLIKLWVAEGFLNRPNGSKSFEEYAEECLEELIKRSLVLATKRKSNGKIKSCSLHDLMRDLCIKKAEQEKFFLRVRYRDTADVLERTKILRRIIVSPTSVSFLGSIYGPSIRTILGFWCWGITELGSLRNFRLLRVLDMELNSVIPLPEQVFELFHLRYLSFAQAHNIPAAISNLLNLQTLIILSTTLCLPLEIWSMSQLRHLVSSSFDQLPIPKGETFSLENLQTLSAVRNLRCTKKVLKMIPNLKKLSIIYSGDNCDGDYQLNNLVYLHQLEKLKLSVQASSRFLRILNAAFPGTLKKLTLSGWRLFWKDMIIIGSLPNLQMLKLTNIVFQGNQWETTEGQFPQLQFLLINGSDLQYWIAESSHFPNLKYLVLHGCLRLSEIPYGIGEIPTLELIEVDDWDKSLLKSAKQIQEERLSYEDYTLQVRAVHY